MSTSTDGFVFFWDTRRLGEPIETLELKVKGSEDILGAVSLEYEAAAGPTKFMLGTEQGAVGVLLWLSIRTIGTLPFSALS